MVSHLESTALSQLSNGLLDNDNCLASQKFRHEETHQPAARFESQCIKPEDNVTCIQENCDLIDLHIVVEYAGFHDNCNCSHKPCLPISLLMISCISQSFTKFDNPLVPSWMMYVEGLYRKTAVPHGLSAPHG